MTDIDVLLARTLRERASDVSEPVDLADRARRRARSLRRRRSAAVVTAGTLAVAAMLLPQSLGDDRRTAPPAQQVPTVDLETPPGARSEIALDDLRQGPRPGLPRLDGGTFHRADGREVPVPSHVTVAAAYLDGAIAYRPADHGLLYMLDASGRTVETAHGSPPVVGRYGEVAYVDQDAGALVVRLPDGGGWRADLSVDREWTAVGFLQDESVVVQAGQEGGRPAVLVVSRLEARKGPGTGRVTATSPIGRELGVVRTDLKSSPCIELWHMPSRAPTWRSCPTPADAVPYVGISAFSGHHMVVQGPDRLAVARVDSGMVVRELALAPGTRAAVGRAVFENSEHLLVPVWQDGRAAIVRCDLDGACERATSWRLTARADWNPSPFGRDW